MSFTIPRTAILRNITAFLSHDNSLLANSVIKWKCIASEFRAILIRLGISKVYVETFQAVQATALKDDADKLSIVTVAEDHKCKAEEFMGNNGQAVLSCLLLQSVEQISSILEPNQLVLEYCFVQEDSDESNTSRHPSGVLVAMQAQTQVQIFSIDFTKALPLAQKWAKVLSDPDCAKDAKMLAEELCNTLIPPVISNILDADPKKQVFLCPDVSLTVIPLELLLFKDGLTLGEKCTTTYMSSSREFLRNAVIKAVSYFEKYFDNFEEKLPENSSLSPPQSSSDNVATVSEAKPSDRPENEEISPQTDDKESQQDFTNSVENTKEETPPPEKELECIIVAAPNFNLEKPATQAGLLGGIIQGFASLFSSKPVESEDVGEDREVKKLVGAEKEAMEVEKILSESTFHLKIRSFMKDDATLARVLYVQSPLILHFSTHGFSTPEHKGYHSSFWDDTKTGLLLAGANTYRQGRLEQIAIEAGTGELTALAACGMNLRGTRLVYLSACVSSYGRYSYNESINSLAEAFRSAGAETIIATLWQVFDDTAQKFACYFYSALCSSGTTCTPSQALTQAKKKLQDDTSYKHWIYWSSFICIGEDKPVFRTN